MGRQFDGDVRIFLQQIRQAIECCGRFRGDVCTVEGIKDIAHENGDVHRGERKLQHVLVRSVDGVDVQAVGRIEIALAGGEENIVDAGRDSLLKRTVGLDGQFEIRPVAADHLHLSGREFVAVLFVDPTFDCEEVFGIGKFVEFVPSSAAGAARRGEESTVVEPVEGHAEIIALRIEGRGQRFYGPAAGQGVFLSTKEVESSHSSPSVRREIEGAVGAEGGKHFTSRCIELRAEIFDDARVFVAFKFGTPKVGLPFPTGHVRNEIKPTAVGGDGGLGNVG